MSYPGIALFTGISVTICVIISFLVRDQGASQLEVVQTIALGFLTSIITGFAIVTVDRKMQEAQRKLVENIPAAFAILQERFQSLFGEIEQRVDRFQGTWAKLVSSAATAEDPNHFWIRERMSEAECRKTLYIVGRSHRTIFHEVDSDDLQRVTDAVTRVLRNDGTIKIAVLASADTVAPIKSVLAAARRAVPTTGSASLHLVPDEYDLNYSGLLNDEGAWFLPRLNEITSDRSPMLCIGKRTASYYFSLLKSDLELVCRRYQETPLDAAAAQGGEQVAQLAQTELPNPRPPSRKRTGSRAGET